MIKIPVVYLAASTQTEIPYPEFLLPSIQSKKGEHVKLKQNPVVSKHDAETMTNPLPMTKTSGTLTDPLSVPAAPILAQKSQQTLLTETKTAFTQIQLAEFIDKGIQFEVTFFVLNQISFFNRNWLFNRIPKDSRQK